MSRWYRDALTVAVLVVLGFEFWFSSFRFRVLSFRFWVLGFRWVVQVFDFDIVVSSIIVVDTLLWWAEQLDYLPRRQYHCEHAWMLTGQSVAGTVISCAQGGRFIGFVGFVGFIGFISFIGIMSLVALRTGSVIAWYDDISVILGGKRLQRHKIGAAQDWIGTGSVISEDLWLLAIIIGSSQWANSDQSDDGHWVAHVPMHVISWCWQMIIGQSKRTRCLAYRY